MMLETSNNHALLELRPNTVKLIAQMPSMPMSLKTAPQLLHAKAKKHAMLQSLAMLEMMPLLLNTHQQITVILSHSNTATLSGKTAHQSHVLTQLLCKTLLVTPTALMLKVSGNLDQLTLTQINHFSELLVKKLLLMMEKVT